MWTTVKTDLKLPPLNPKKRQHLTVFQQRKRAKRDGLYWKLLKSGTQMEEIRRKHIHFGAKVQSTKRQSADVTLRGRSWKHVNRLSPPEATMSCFRLQSQKLGNILWFLWNIVPKSTEMCTSMILWSLPCVIWKSTSKMKVQQDGAPSHSSNKNQVWCKDNFLWFWRNELWLP